MAPSSIMASVRIIANSSRRVFCRSLSTSADASPPAAEIAGGAVNQFAMNQYILACTSTKQAAIVDCGASSKEELEQFLTWMDERKYNLVTVLQTHAHLDHVAGLNLIRTVHPDVPIHLHERDLPLYEGFEDRISAWGFQAEAKGPLPTDNLHLFDDGKKSIQVGQLDLEILPTPGHCPGHVGYYEPKTKSFFGGDLIMQGSVGRTDFPESSQSDMTASLKRVIRLGDREDDFVIYSGHGPATTLKEEKVHNPFLKDVM
mmetsp:Transcript_13271/g.22085  ORF Transcript_13271/g.22085 Transcript_13271/m.22085 type:complete len:259 (-) Transcript_13271:313-1089(-)